MSFQICIKTDKPLQQLATEIRDLLSLPSFKQDSFAGEPYCQFEMLGTLVLIHRADEEDRDPEVMDYPYCFDLQMSFVDHELSCENLIGCRSVLLQVWRRELEKRPVSRWD